MSHLIPNVVEDIAQSSYQSLGEFLDELLDPWTAVQFECSLAEAGLNAAEQEQEINEYLELSV